MATLAVLRPGDWVRFDGGKHQVRGRGHVGAVALDSGRSLGGAGVVHDGRAGLRCGGRDGGAGALAVAAVLVPAR